MDAPCVALFGSNGFIGKEILPTFLNALQTRELSSLKLATQNPRSSAYDAARTGGAIVCLINFGDKLSLRRMLEDVDVVVSCMGTGGDSKENKKLLVEACAEANVKVYVPSEWGTDHLHIRYQHPMFASKQEHQSYAQSLGLKSIAIYTGMIMETSFCKWFGFDTKNRTWNIDAERDYESKKASIPPNMIGPLMNLLVADGSFDHSSNAREIINPGQCYFKWTTVDDYAREVGGLPWENESPW
ncbi:hypothetical protein N7462_008397 [Penicillium macrosclerotiorum]|uniref:uncharacterized protein n=1 Tax=Penicillium macrosclerotiorum TaxID=303699 RepID=UPI0025481412|nr:uncharacterized protein N7462_008397 [Penicillium macrosclerotiorum]KAJ5675500.1 hypothetical protein N7462_008397 [Penicillium macrosclerotiorum]